MATKKLNSLPNSLSALTIFSLLFIFVASTQQTPLKPINNLINKHYNRNDNEIPKKTSPRHTHPGIVVPLTQQMPPKPINTLTNKHYNKNGNEIPKKTLPRHTHHGSRKNPNFLVDFVSAHNQERFPIGHQPLKWNYTVAHYAKHWAKKRAHDCKLIHSYGPYGENLFWGGRTDWPPNAVVKSWVDEKVHYDPKSNTCAQGQMCGHYTQVVWKKTVSVGCARVQCKNGKGLYVICNYDPPGNYVDETPFGE